MLPPDEGGIHISSSFLMSDEAIVGWERQRDGRPQTTLVLGTPAKRAVRRPKPISRWALVLRQAVSLWTLVRSGTGLAGC